jgi:septation ring formation regulator EzrA
VLFDPLPTKKLNVLIYIVVVLGCVVVVGCVREKREDKIVLGLIPIKNNLLKSQYN